MAKFAADKEIEMARVESIERETGKARKAILIEIECEKEAKLASKLEVEKLKNSFQRQHSEFMIQFNLQKAVIKIALEKQIWLVGWLYCFFMSTVNI